MRNVTLIFLLTSALAMTACSERLPNSLRIGYIPIADNAQLYVAVEQAYFDQEGLNVELRSMSGGPKIVEALISRGSDKIDIGYSNLVSIIAARAQGLPVVAIAGGPVETMGRPTHAVLVRSDSNIQSVKDLEGKVLAINALRNIDHLMVLRYLEKGGVNPDSVRIVEAGFPQMEAVLLTGAVDAVATIEPFLTFSLKRDNIRVLDYHYAVVEPRSAVGSYLTTEQWLQANDDLARRFVSAIGKATGFIRDDEPATRRILVQYTQVDETTTANMHLTAFQNQHETGDIRQWIDEMLRWKLISNPVDASVVFRSF